MNKNDSLKAWSGYFSSHFGIQYTTKELMRSKNFLHGQLKIFATHCEPRATDKILEVGCGIGALVALLKGKGIQDITAIELDDQAAEFVRQTQAIKVFNCDIAGYVPEGKFSKIYAFEVLEHLEDPLGDLHKISSLLEPNGFFIGSTPYPFRKNVESDSSHLFVLHPENWARLFGLAGLHVVFMRPTSAIPYLYRLSSLFSIFLPFYIPGLKIVTTTLFIVQKKVC